jgi:hypothetical protein
VTTPVRERILTDNEKYGNGLLDEDAPGAAWIVLGNGFTGGYVAHVFSNRQACEDYIYDKCDSEDYRRAGITPDQFSIQVWAISETWPDEEGDE